MLDVGGGALDRHRGLVLRVECEAPSREDFMPARGPELVPKLLAQSIVPGPREFRYVAFQLAHRRSLRRLGGEAEVKPRGIAFAEREKVVDEPAFEAVLQCALDPDPHLR